MTAEQRETVAMLGEIAPHECEDPTTEFDAAIVDGMLSFEMYSESVYRSGTIGDDGVVSWN